MYIYAGDSIQEGAGNGQPAIRRRAVAILYIKGLAEAEALHLPAIAPDLPVVPKYEVSDPNDPIIKEHDKALEAWDRAAEIRELIAERKTLIGQIAWIYRNVKAADSELNEIVKANVPDALLATKIVVEIEGAIARPERPK